VRKITNEMAKAYRVKELGYDMMGYEKQKDDLLTFHHLIIPRRRCQTLGYGDGYFWWNGAILYTTPHDYIHIIEGRDADIYLYITQQLIAENEKGYIDINNIRRIHDALSSFEKEHSADRTRTGKILIREQYTRRKKV